MIYPWGRDVASPRAHRYLARHSKDRSTSRASVNHILPVGFGAHIRGWQPGLLCYKHVLFVSHINRRFNLKSQCVIRSRLSFLFHYAGKWTTVNRWYRQSQENRVHSFKFR